MSTLEEFTIKTTPKPSTTLDEFLNVDWNLTESVDSNHTTKDVESKITESNFNKTSNSVLEILNSNDLLITYRKVLSWINFSKLTESTTKEIINLFENIIKSNDLNTRLNLIWELQGITTSYEVKKDQVVEGASDHNSSLSVAISSSNDNIIDETIDLLWGNIETVDDIFTKVWDSFWETWTEILKNWGVDSEEEVSYIGAIFSTIWDVAWLALLDMVWQVWVVDLWVKIVLKDIAFLFKNWLMLDFEVFKKLWSDAWEEKDPASIGLLALFIIAHINFWYWAFKRFRDRVVSSSWEEWKKSKEWSFFKKMADKYYIDATVKDTPIFSLDTALSSNQNEDIKRVSSFEALHNYYYDNPKIQNELKLIQLTSMKSNTNQYFRRIWRLTEKHWLIRKIIVRSTQPAQGKIVPHDIFWKSEKETEVLNFINKIRNSQKETIKLLYKTESSWEIIKENKTIFLKWLYSSIENNTDLTKKEKDFRVTNLNTLLSQITSNRLIDEKRLMEELYRIKEWYSTKIESLSIIQKEIDDIDKVEKWWKIKRFLKWSKNKILLKKHHLIRLRDRVAKGNFDWVTKEVLKDEINKTIKSKILHWWTNQKISFPKHDEFKDDIELKYKSIEDLIKLYDNWNISNFKNYIKYILPNSSEEETKIILKEFEEAKSPYDKLSFYRELDRIKNWFLPSNQLIEKLLTIKEEFENKNKIKENSAIKNSINYLKKLSVKIESSSDWEKIDNSIKNNLKNKIKLLTSNLMKRNTSEIKSELKDIGKTLSYISNIEYKNFIDFFKNKKIIFSNNNTHKIKDNKIDNVSELIDLARKWELDIKKSEMWNIKIYIENNFINIDDFQSQDFDEIKQNNLIDDLKKYNWLDNHDYKKELKIWENSSLPEIKEALKWRFKTELTYIDLLNQWWEKFWDVKTEINNLAELIQKNDLTLWQASRIEQIILRWQKIENIDIDYITNNTIDHSLEIDSKIVLTKQLRNIFEWIDDVKKENILKYIWDSDIDKAMLPDFINEYKDSKIEESKKIKQQEELNKAKEKHTKTLNSKIEQINTRRNITQLDRLESDFNNYLDESTNNINRADYTDLINEFETEYNRQYDNLDTNNWSNLSVKNSDLEKIKKLELKKLKNILNWNNDLEKLFNDGNSNIKEIQIIVDTLTELKEQWINVISSDYLKAQDILVDFELEKILLDTDFDLESIDYSKDMPEWINNSSDLKTKAKDLWLDAKKVITDVIKNPKVTR